MTPRSRMTQIRWGRVILLAVSLEAVLFVTLVPLISKLSWPRLMIVIAAGCVVFSYIAGWLVARGLSSGQVRHGFLVGTLATIIYLTICVLGPGGLSGAVAFYGAPLFVSLNALRITGCVVGRARRKDALMGSGRRGLPSKPAVKWARSASPSTAIRRSALGTSWRRRNSRPVRRHSGRVRRPTTSRRRI